MQDQQPNYDSICRLVGRLFLETQHQNERLSTQFNTMLLDLQQKLAQSESKLKEFQKKDFKESKDAPHGILPT